MSFLHYQWEKPLRDPWNGQGHGQGLGLKISLVVVGKDGGEAVKEDPQVGRVEGQTRSEPGNHERFFCGPFM